MHVNVNLRQHTRTAAGENARHVAAMFGVPDEPAPLRVRRRIGLLPGRVTLLVGASGAGKSTTLRAVGRTVAQAGGLVVHAEAIDVTSEAALVDTFPGLPLERVLGLLSRAGLSEAAVLLRPAWTLSEGQKFRYRLARAMALLEPKGGLLCADGFAETLDDTAARVVAFGLRRWLEETAVAALVATTREDLAEDLRPAQVVRFTL